MESLLRMNILKRKKASVSEFINWRRKNRIVRICRLEKKKKQMEF